MKDLILKKLFLILKMHLLRLKKNMRRKMISLIKTNGLNGIVILDIIGVLKRGVLSGIE
tara:strand:+ start:108 stop:284 length:177 start_codon:yes stop_codon:yes gene_type:complete